MSQPLLSGFLTITSLSLACVLYTTPLRAQTHFALNPDLPPSGNFDLSKWALTLPTPIGGIGNAEQVESKHLVSGYTNPPYFFTGSRGSMNFWAPDNGATTTDATHPRSELLEEWNGRGSTWTISQFSKNTLTATMLVSKVPQSGLIVIGQIHNNGVTDPYGNEVITRPLLKIMYSSKPKDPNGDACLGCVYAEIRPAAGSDEYHQLDYTLATNLPLKQLFTYSASLENSGKLIVTVNGKSHLHRINTSNNNTVGWGAQGLYFKAGAYVLDHGTSSTDGGEVDIYSLDVMHR